MSVFLLSLESFGRKGNAGRRQDHSGIAMGIGSRQQVESCWSLCMHVLASAEPLQGRCDKNHAFFQKNPFEVDETKTKLYNQAEVKM